MKTLLVYGIDTVAGANIACTLADRYSVVGVAEKSAPTIARCQILTGRAATAAPERILADVQPDHVIDAACCGDSSWNPQAQIGQTDQCDSSLTLAKACAAAQVPLVFVSADAVLTGPWMFHEEDSASTCASVVGQRLAKLEQTVLGLSGRNLVVRTHLFGWSGQTEEAGWLESLLARMSAGQICRELNQPGYATPLLATELAEVLHRGLEEQLSGLFHVSGAERVNRLQFARRLAQVFEVSKFRSPLIDGHFTQQERKNFACGESSLQTRAIRRELCLAMPTLTESMEKLCEQQTSGYRNRLAVPAVSLARAA